MKRVLLSLLMLAGCQTAPPQVCPLEYREVPEAYLQECPLPPLPQTNGEKEDALVQSYQCAQIGNADKARIRELTQSPLQQ